MRPGSRDSFGNVTRSTGSLANPFQYTGRDFDAETGLYYYRARYYDPSSGRFLSGRFLSSDPVGFNSGDVNFYRYSLNNPITLWDPYGWQSGVATSAGGVTVTIETTITVVSTEGTSTYAPVLTLVAEGSGEGATAGPIGALVGVIGAVGTYDAYQFYNLGQAYGWWGGSGSNGAGSSTAKGKCKNDCEKEWEDAREMCRELLSRPNPPRGLTGGYKDIENCARGLVSEECGGNRVDHGQKK